MLIRKLTRDDLPAVAAITRSSFAKDELFAWLWPKQDQYPDDIRRYQSIRLRTRLVSKGQHGFVMVTEESDADWTGKTEVVGYAFFERSGDDDAARAWQGDSLFNKLERHLLSWELFYEAKFLDRASDPERIKAYANTTHYDFYSLLDPRWHVGILGVSTKYQRRGIGGKLIQHVQKLATEENVPITLESSVVGRGLYLKSGFKIVDETKIDEGLDDLAMVWEPEHLKGKWLEDRGDGRANVIARE